MKKSHPFLKLISITALFAISSHAEVIQKPTDFLKEQLASYPKKTKEVFPLNEKLKSSLKAQELELLTDQVTFYYGKDASGALKLACLLTFENGKEGMIQVGTCFEKDGTTKSYKILESSEDRGRAALNPDYLTQFTKSKSTEGLGTASKIDGLSGATITWKALVRAKKKASLLFNELVLKGKTS